MSGRRLISLIDKQFGDIRVLSYSHLDKINGRMWNCICKCNNEILLPTRRLNNKTTHCGAGICAGENFIGLKFGKLTVKEYVGVNKHRRLIWKCLCDCGKIVNVSSLNLKSGNSKSCGKCKFINLTGIRFNKLIVISLAYNDSVKYWNCVCDCGNKVILTSAVLKNKITSSCGCAYKIKETELYNILKQIFPRYIMIKNYRGFDWLKNQKNMEIDIWIPELKLAIEYDGEQHFKPVRFGGSKREAVKKFKYVVKMDKLKNKLISLHPKDIKTFVRVSYKEKVDIESVLEIIKKHGVIQ